MIVTTPADTPVTEPEAVVTGVTVAIDGLLLVHVPPGSRLSTTNRDEPIHSVPVLG